MPSTYFILAAFSAWTALVALTAPHLAPLAAPYIPDVPTTLSSLLRAHDNATHNTTTPEPDPPPFTCVPHTYTSEIVSVEPLLIYMRSFLTPAETAALLAAADPLFRPSTVTKHGRTVASADRTSRSAALPRDHPAVGCVLARARAFMGALFAPGRDDMGAPQLVRYGPGQRFNAHHDWYERPQRAAAAAAAPGTRDRWWNRPVSFFAVLQDDCVGGATHFPLVRPLGAGADDDDKRAALPWYEHEGGGLAFRPVAGNALFWVNLHPNGSGDGRTLHAGLPLVEGMKTAMNIWPKRYTGPDA